MITQINVLSRGLPGAVLAAAMFVVQFFGAASAQQAPEYVEMTLGNPDAEVTLVEYLSFTCPHCASFHEDSFVRLKEEYIDTGKVRFVAREVYLDRPGLWASILARCGGSGKFFGLTDILFKQQASWSRASTAAEIVERLTSIGRAGGLTTEQINACFTDEANAKLLYDAASKFAAEDGIQGTPTFTINGELYGNMSYPELAALLDDALNK